MTLVKELHPVTMAEFETMEKQEGLTYELIDGAVMMSPRPAVKHQKVSGKTYAKLLQILEGKNCEPILEIDLVLEQNNFVPDLMVVCDENLDDMVRYEKPPLIIIEIVSPSSAAVTTLLSVKFTKNWVCKSIGLYHLEKDVLQCFRSQQMKKHTSVMVKYNLLSCQKSKLI